LRQQQPSWEQSKRHSAPKHSVFPSVRCIIRISSALRIFPAAIPAALARLRTSFMFMALFPFYRAFDIGRFWPLICVPIKSSTFFSSVNGGLNVGFDCNPVFIWFYLI
jgi:hypothetical protein